MLLPDQKDVVLFPERVRRPLPGVHAPDAGIVLPRPGHLARRVARPRALGQASPGRTAAARTCGTRRGSARASRRSASTAVARGLPRRRPHEPVRHGRDAARRRRPLEGARSLVAPAARPRARLRAHGVPARRGVPERARDARATGVSASTTAPPTRAWRPPTSRSPTSSPTSIRAEAARPAHPPAAGRRARTRWRSPSTPTPRTSSSSPKNRGSRVSRASTTPRAARRAVRRLGAHARLRGGAVGPRSARVRAVDAGPDGRWWNFVYDWRGTRNETGVTSSTGENFWHARALLGVSHAWLTFGDQRALEAHASRARPCRHHAGARRRPCAARARGPPTARGRLDPRASPPPCVVGPRRSPTGASATCS